MHYSITTSNYVGLTYFLFYSNNIWILISLYIPYAINLSHPCLTSSKDLGDFENIAPSSTVMDIDSKQVDNLKDETLTTVADGGKTAGKAVEFTFTLPTASAYGIWKIIVYSKTDSEDMAGWQAYVKFKGTKTTSQSNSAADGEVECKEKSTSTSLGDHEFLCPINTAANIVIIRGAATTVDLAEVVIGGLTWDLFSCEAGYYNTGDGTHATDDTAQDCEICKDGTRTNERKQTECKDCVNTSKNIFYTSTFVHKKEDDCQVCVGYQVANTAKNGCIDCPVGEKYTAVCTPALDVADFNDKAKLKACTSITCTPCSATFEAIVADMKDLTPKDMMYKCLLDTGEACVALTPITSVYGTYNPLYAKVGEDKSFDCEFDCKDKTDCTLKAVFKCEKKGDVNAFRPVYNCIRTSKSETFEELAKKKDQTNADKSKEFKTLAEDDSDNNGIGDLEQASSIINAIVAHESDTVDQVVLENIVAGVSNIVDGQLHTNYTKKSNEIVNSVVKSLNDAAYASTAVNQLVTSKNIAAIKVTGGETGTPNPSGIAKFSLPRKSGSDGLSDIKLVSDGTESDDTVLMIETKEGSKVQQLDMTVLLLHDSKLFPNSQTPDVMAMMESSKPEDEGERKKVINSLISDVTIRSAVKDLELNLYMRPLANIGSIEDSTKTFDDGRKTQVQYRCSSFDTVENGWKDDCQTVYNPTLDDAGVICLCEHNTSFAVLMSPYPIDPGFIKSQTLMSTILLAIAMICLTLTLVCLLLAAPLRKQRSTKINICFSFSLLLASFTFLLQNVLVKGDNTGPIKLGSPGCIAYAAIQHYLWLVVFLWMVVEGILMYLSLVQVFGSHISKYMLKFNIMCWGGPILFPIIGYFAFTKTVSVGDYSVVQSDFIADNMCFLKPGGLPFWIFFFVPLIIAILVNLVFFVLVLNVIRDSKNVQVSERELILRQIKAAVGVMVLLGTGWIIGVFMALPEPNTQIILQYLFILLNSSQGICVFIFYVILNEQVTNHWLSALGIKSKIGTSSSNSMGGNSAGTKDTALTSKASNKSKTMANKTENVYENAAVVKDDDHTYDTASEFPAKSEENGNI